MCLHKHVNVRFIRPRPRPCPRSHPLQLFPISRSSQGRRCQAPCCSHLRQRMPTQARGPASGTRHQRSKLGWRARPLHTFPDVRVASLEPLEESKTCSSPGAPPASNTDPSGEDPRRPRDEPAVHPGTRSVAVWAFVATSHTMTRPSPDLLATRPPANDTKLSTRLLWPAGVVGKGTQSLLVAAALVAGAASARSACFPALADQCAVSNNGSPARTRLCRQFPFQYRSAAGSHEEGVPVRLQEWRQQNTRRTSQASERTLKTAVVAVGIDSVEIHVSVFTFQTRTCKEAWAGEHHHGHTRGAQRTVPSLETDASRWVLQFIVGACQFRSITTLPQQTAAT